MVYLHIGHADTCRIQVRVNTTPDLGQIATRADNRQTGDGQRGTSTQGRSLDAGTAQKEIENTHTFPLLHIKVATHQDSESQRLSRE
jgi:hypothetical protein